MLNIKLLDQIKQNFFNKPTSGQELTMNLFVDFLLSSQPDTVFLLKGYAGTGKTSLVSALVRTLDGMKQKCILLAPTGRAAKVFALHSGHPAYTIHRRIYRQRTFSNEMDNFTMNVNLHQHTLFIVDEASMISNLGLSGNVFGSGRLLDDLIQYVYGGQGCRLVLVGDTAQLPPVGEEESPALSADVLRGYGLEVVEQELTQVVRQESESGILYNATCLRRKMAEEFSGELPRIRVEGFPDVRVVLGSELIETLNTCYGREGMDETIVICRSNKRANLYNQGIRNTILYREDELNAGDILMVAKNNYFWGADVKELDFIANGDIAELIKISNYEERYGLHFAEAVLAFPDYGDVEITAKVILDTLTSESASLPAEQQSALYEGVFTDYSDISTKRKRNAAVREDPYYNALQIKYSTAITCHKSQGGQWKCVFIDNAFWQDTLTVEDLKWLYTALTRATKKLYLVNFNKKFFD